MNRMSTNDTITIGVKTDTYNELVGMSTSKKDTFDSIIKRLIQKAKQDTQKDEKTSPQVSALHIPMLAPTCEATGNLGGCP